MAAQVAAGLAPWTRTAGFIANRLKVLEAELQASQTQLGSDAAASQQREQRMQAQIEELEQHSVRYRLAAAEELAGLQSSLPASQDKRIRLVQNRGPSINVLRRLIADWESKPRAGQHRHNKDELATVQLCHTQVARYSTARYCVEYSLAALRLLVDCNLSFEKVQETIVRALGLHILPGQQLEDRVPCGMTLRRAMDDICHQAHKHQSAASSWGTAASPGGTAASPGGTAASPGGTAASPGGTAASPGGTAPSPGGTAASPGGTAASPGGTAASPGGTAASPGGTAASPGGTAASPGGGTQALATNKARPGKRQQQAPSKAERVMKRIRCLVSMPSDEQRAAAVAVRDSVTARQQQQQVDSKRLKELEDTARGVYNRFEPPLPALRSKGISVEELKHLSQKLVVGSVAALVLIAAAAALSSDDRDGAFVGYHEKAAGCLDRMEDCAARALGNGCAYDPFNLRSFCPVACDLEKCSHRGHKKVLHKGRATSHGTLAFQAAMVKQLNLPDSLYKSVKLLMSEEALALSGLGVGTYLGEGDEATDEASVAALLYSVTHGWNVIDTGKGRGGQHPAALHSAAHSAAGFASSNYRSGHSEQALGTALNALLAGDEADSFSQGTVEAAAALVNRYEIPPPPLVSTLRGLAKPEDLTDVTATVTASVLHKGADLTRDMLFISTKAGFTTPGLVERLVREGRLGQRDVVSGQHSLHPAYLEASLELSLTRLHLQT
ncbi:hypothetical protein QJQ45_015390, partial [Haematococcus lacustris]